MQKVNIHEAKTHLSRLLARVAAGEEIVIAKSGRPIARLVPFSPPLAKREPGLDRGLLVIPDEFHEPLPDDVLDRFEA